MVTTKTRARFRCRECDTELPKWIGRCPECGAWDAVVETAPAPAPASGPGPLTPLAGAGAGGDVPVPTGVGELDRALGGGLVPGSVTLIGGEPGIGKSTLVLQALAGLAGAGCHCLLVTAEESPRHVAARAERVGAAVPGVSILAATSLPAVTAAVEQHGPDVVVVDSVQTVADPDTGGVAGSVTQVRECAATMVALAKQREIAVVLVGHVTKDGDLAGPRALEHVVDTVVSFEGERHHALRLLRVLKHRFGATTETGVLEMRGDGLADVPDPSGLFLADRAPGAPGSVVAPVLEGARPLLVEVQALVTDPSPPVPRRSVQGLESKRVGLLLAVLAERAGVKLAGRDVYASVAGGLRVAEPGADLAVALALAGAFRGSALDPSTVVLGEVGLGGEVRQVAHAPRRLGEAARLGFSRAIVPLRTPAVAGMELARVSTLGDAVSATGPP